jgi:PST family polysaccharide transporter
VILTVVTTVQVGVISAYHQIGRVARINISNSVVGPLILVPLVLGWRESALPWVVLLGSVATVTVSAAYFPREALGVLSVRRYRGRRSGLGAAVGELLRFGVPFNVSAIAGTGVQLAMPVVVLHVLGDAAVGFYRAAAGISLTYLAFLQSALGQDYYPRIAACGDDTVRQAALVEDQIRAVLLVAGPIILVVLAAAPVLVPLIYTREFVPAVALLEWQLAGDVLRIAATTMSLAILARAGGLTFLGVEVFTGAATLAMSWVGVRALALPGLGMAFFASSLVAACANAVVLRRVLGRSLGGRTLMVIAGYTAAALVTRFIASAGLGAPGALAAGAVALAGVAFSARAIWTEVDGWEGLRKLFRLA